MVEHPTLDASPTSTMAPVRFQLVSDLHLESPKAYDIYNIPTTAPNLILAGDLGCTNDPGLFDFLEAQLAKFHKIFFLFGNHEPYGIDWAKAKSAIADFSTCRNNLRATDPSLGEFIVLDQTRHDLSESVTILGCTLYSRVGPTAVEMDLVNIYVPDFREIRDWTVDLHNAAFAADLAWLNAQVAAIEREEPGRRVIIVSHHSPTRDARAVQPSFATSPITSAFSTDLTAEVCWTSRSVRMWAFGHTHYNCDFEGREGLQVVTNQRGYYSEQASGFVNERVFEV